MAATRDDIRGWLNRSRSEGATHMLVVTDTYDYDDFPVSVFPGENPSEKMDEYRKDHRVMEVYSLTGKHDLEFQLREHCAFHFD